MKYLYVFGGVAVLSAIGAVLMGRATRLSATFWFGILLTLLAVVGFVLNKSDSVDDTFVEKLAVFVPPLISFSIVIGWWVGYAILRLLPRRHT